MLDSNCKQWKKDNNSALINILKFIYFQRERVEKKEISGATVVNYVKSIKLFCDMADIPIHLKRITHRLPRGKKYADDRIPTLEQLSYSLRNKVTNRLTQGLATGSQSFRGFSICLIWGRVLLSFSLSMIDKISFVFSFSC